MNAWAAGLSSLRGSARRDEGERDGGFASMMLELAVRVLQISDRAAAVHAAKIKTLLGP